MGAVAVHVAANGETSDLDKLHADIAERVRAANPDGRSPGDMARYASRKFVADKLHWALEQERAERAKAAAQEPVEPEHPNNARGWTGEVKDAVHWFVDKVQDNLVPRLLLRVTWAAGKHRWPSRPFRPC